MYSESKIKSLNLVFDSKYFYMMINDNLYLIRFGAVNRITLTVYNIDGKIISL